MLLVLWIAIPIGVVYVLATVLPVGPPGASGAVKFVDVLQQLPTRWYFYALILTLIGLWLYRHRKLHTDLRERFASTRVDANGHDLNERDWWVAEEFRKRALDLRLRADLILVSTLAVLFGGVYFVIFVAQQIPEIDKDTANLRKEAAFKHRFAEELNALVLGRYWLKVNDEQGKDLFNGGNNASTIEELQLIVLTPPNNEDTWDRHVLKFKHEESGQAAEFSSSGMTGLVSGDDGSVYTTTDRGKTWTVPTIASRGQERIVRAGISADGTTAVVLDDSGSVHMSKDSGKTWRKTPVDLMGRMGRTRIGLSADGMTALVTAADGVIHISTDGGKAWTETRSAQNGESYGPVGIGADGLQALIVGSQGSVQVTTDGGKTWSQSQLELADAEWVAETAFGADVMTAMVIGDEGSVHMTTDGGKTWSESNLELADGERIAGARFIADGTAILVVDHRGSVRVTTDGGATWTKSNLELEDEGRVVEAHFAANGMEALLLDYRGTVHITTDGGQTWNHQELDLPRGERVVFATVGENIESAVLFAVATLVSARPSDQHDWIKTNLKLERGEEVGAVAFDVSDATGVVVSQQGSAVVTQDGGKRWSQHTFKLNDGENIASAAWVSDGSIGLVAGNGGSAFVTTDDGGSWRLTRGLDNLKRVDLVEVELGVNVSSHDSGFVAETPDGYYTLVKYPMLEGWREWTLARIRDGMTRNEALSESEIYRVLSKVYEADGDPNGNAIAMTELPKSDDEGTQDKKKYSDAKWTLAHMIDNTTLEVTIMRIVTVAVVFFLAQILIRLSQYSMRVAAFWDSRADAVLLKQSLAARKAKRFDSLVNSLSPDAYDFKSPPKSPFDGFRMRR